MRVLSVGGDRPRPATICSNETAGGRGEAGNALPLPGFCLSELSLSSDTELPKLAFGPLTPFRPTTEAERDRTLVPC
jgi:hypothetical protein